MGRLIDESELIEIIQGSEELLDFQKDECINCIKACDTTYDPDKVVEQLEKEKNPIYREDESIMSDRQNIKIDKAIEIVKGGGVDG